jgi:hypothetical protein
MTKPFRIDPFGDDYDEGETMGLMDDVTEAHRKLIDPDSGDEIDLDEDDEDVDDEDENDDFDGDDDEDDDSDDDDEESGEEDEEE